MCLLLATTKLHISSFGYMSKARKFINNGTMIVSLSKFIQYKIYTKLQH
jgi:hypothetical protein